VRGDAARWASSCSSSVCCPFAVLLWLSEGAACVGDTCDRYSFLGRATALHELAHAWDATRISDPTRRSYEEATGLTTWFGREVPWVERAGERAAEVLM
jgi:hypothetical protein